MRPTVPQLDIPGLSWCAGVLRADIWSAVDRPSRCEVELAAPHRSPPEVPSAWRVGRSVDCRLGDRHVFRGVVERAGVVWDRAGSRIRAVAYDEYEERRSRWVGASLFQVSLSEIAERIAFELGLEAEVDEGGEVLNRVLIETDPLRFLRHQARQAGIEFGIAQRRLIFKRRLPDLASLRVVGPRDVAELELDDCGWRGRGGTVKLLGDAEWALLDGVQLRGFGAFADGDYRVVRCRHELDSGGMVSTLSFLEQGLDFEFWRNGSENEVSDAS